MSKARFWAGIAAPVVVSIAMPGVAAAQQAPAGEAVDAGQIVVTGTRASNRTVADSLSPIQVLNTDAISHTGKVGLQEILANVLPSFDIPAQAGGNLSNILHVATMRGLDPDQSLVLVNGKRRHVGSIVNISGTVGLGSQGVDLNMIPTQMIKRVEVLSDGASAQYGSDALAGVINIILKDNHSGGELDAQAGAYYAGDGFNGQGGFNFGFGSDSKNFVSISASYQRQNNTDRGINGTIEPFYYTGDPRNATVSRKVQYGYGIPQTQVATVGYNMAHEITDGIQFYSFGTYGWQQGKQWEGFRAPSNVNDVLALFPNGFQPKENLYQNDFQIDAGLRGDNLAGWDWDLSGSYGQNLSHIYVYDTDNPTYGVDSPTNFYSGSLKATEWVGNFDVTHAYDLGLAKPLSVAAGAEYRRDGYAIGAGQHESYDRGPDPVLTGPSAGLYTDSAGAQSYSGFQPSDVSNVHRDNVGAYIDLEGALLRGWDFGVAGRFEHYSDFGNNWSGKFSTRYQFTNWLALRGTVSNGFRAPSVGEENYSQTVTTQYQGKDYNVGLRPADSAAAEALGSKPLKAETSFNLSAGVVLTPFRHFTFTADAYQIDINNRIALSSNIGLTSSGTINTQVATLLAGYGISNVNVVSYFLNAANTRTRGLDLVANWWGHLPGDWGRLTLNAAVNFNATTIRSLTDEAKQVEYGTSVFSAYSQAELTQNTPRNKEILTANWDIGKLGVMVRENRFGHWVQPSTVTNGFSYGSPAFTTDLEIDYQLTPRIRVGAGAQNLFDVYPSKANALNFVASTFNGANIYNAASPFGISGGNYYARVNVSW